MLERGIPPSDLQIVMSEVWALFILYCMAFFLIIFFYQFHGYPHPHLPHPQTSDWSCWPGKIKWKWTVCCCYVADARGAERGAGGGAVHTETLPRSPGQTGLRSAPLPTVRRGKWTVPMTATFPSVLPLHNPTPTPQVTKLGKGSVYWNHGAVWPSAHVAGFCPDDIFWTA